ncbi:protein-arginine deiminase [Microdochium nivale]|nr:protein-arginine deiminase [Microdochium nivale]
MRTTTFAVLAAAAPLLVSGKACLPPSAGRADIRADSNRDGTVDLTGASDVAGKTQWTAKRGALFLPNIGDTDRRCSRKLLSGSAVANAELGNCHDASDDILRQPKFLAPLRTVPLATLPAGATGRVYVPDAVQQANVRIFAQVTNKGPWTFVTRETSFSAEQLRAGLVLGIDGRDTRRPGGWNGLATVRFDVESTAGRSSDTVQLRVAPVVIHNHLDRVEQVLAVSSNQTSPWLSKFGQDLAGAVSTAGLTNAPYLFNASDDIWVQDFLEPGFASIPGPAGAPVSVRIMVRMPQDERVAGRQLFEYYREAGVGAVQHLGGARDEINSGGNVETIPPYTHNGTTWPAGRVILGDHDAQQHHITAYLDAQEVQQPLHLDAGWLAIGHVDEFVQFLPAPASPRGWVLVADDPRAGVAMLRDVAARGYGSGRAYSRGNDTAPQDCTPFGDTNPATGGSFCDPIPVKGLTVDQVLADAAMLDVQERCAVRIDDNIRRLKEATGLADAEILRMPALFDNNKFANFPGGGGGGANNSRLAVGAFYPGAINGVVMTGYGTYIAPNPWGPRVDGKDVLAAAAAKVYATVGLRTVFVDDWNSHHNFGGEVHCGTNTARDMGRKWW